MQIDFDVLIENLQDMVWVLDNHGNVLYVNELATDLLGYPVSTILGRPLFDFMCPQHHYNEGSCVRLVEQMQIRDFRKEPLWMLHADGQRRIVMELNSKRLKNGKAVEIHGLGRDISDRIALEKANRESSLNALKALVAAVEAKDPYTQGHSLRVAKYAQIIGREMHLSPQRLEALSMASVLHDIGKIGIEDAILSKAGPLTSMEYNKIKEHPVIGARILESAGFPQEIVDAVLYHHKKYDGTGYPEALKTTSTVLTSIIEAADALDAMTSRRTYKPILSREAVVAEFTKNTGTQFCPLVVQALLRVLCEDEAFEQCILLGDEVND